MMFSLSTVLIVFSTLASLNILQVKARHQNGYTSTHLKKNSNSANQQEEEAVGHVHQPLVSLEYVCPEYCKCERDKDLTILEIDCSSKNLSSIPRHLPSKTVKLFLQNNSIQRVSCTDFKQLHRLEILDLSRNLISTLSNCTFLSQSFLDYLNISNCSLVHLETGVFYPLTRMSNLDLSRNGLNTLQKSLLWTLKSLKNLNLYENNIAHIANLTFDELHSLKFLSLQKNKLLYLEGTFESAAFKGLERLEILHIQGNHPDPQHPNTTYPDVALSALQSLREMKMDGCPVTPGLGFRQLTNLTSLDLSTNIHVGTESFCSMDTFIPANFFIHFNTRQPFFLNMTGCGLKKIPPSLFKPLPNIFSLIIRDNDNLKFEGFSTGSKGLANSNLTHLDISGIYGSGKEIWSLVTNTTFKFLKNTKLKSLIMRDNHVMRIDPKAILDLPSTLEYLNMRQNRIQFASFWLILVTLRNLKILDASDQLLYRSYEPKGRYLKGVKREIDGDKNIENKSSPLFPDNKMVTVSATMRKKRNSFDSESKKKISALKFSTDSYHQFQFDESCPHFPRNKVTTSKTKATIPFPRRLEVVLINNLKSGYSIPPLNIHGNKVLRHLEYSKNMAYCWKGPLEGVPSLQYLDLSENWCTQMSLTFFKYLTNLTTLLLHQNSLGQTLADDINGVAFSTLTNLSVLDLSVNSIKDLATNVFANNILLTRLNLAKNEISHFDPVLFNIKRLEHLDLSVNTLSSLSEQNCRDFQILKSRNPNFTVNLLDNRFLCSCNNIPYFILALNDPTLFSNVTYLYCKHPNGTIIEYSRWHNLMSELVLNCQAETVFTITFICFCLAIGCLLVSSVYYYKRWKLAYLYYIGKKRLHVGAVPINFQPLAKVFVTYEQDETKWRRFLQQTFLPRLREEGITYILGEVDFEGGHMNSHIAGAVVGTEKTLVLLSQDIFQDTYRELEVNLAIMHELNTRAPVLVPVFLERVNLELYPVEIATFLVNQEDRCLEYNDTPEFWAQLLLAINYEG